MRKGEMQMKVKNFFKEKKKCASESSEDEKKLWAAEWCALTKIKQKSFKLRVSKFSNTAKSQEFQATQVPGSSASATSLPFSAHFNFHQPFCATQQVQPSDLCLNCYQRGHWANLPACPLFYKTRGSLANTGASSTSTKSTTVWFGLQDWVQISTLILTLTWITFLLIYYC